MSEHNPHKAIDHILKVGPKFAKAKSERVQIAEYRKSKKSILMLEAPPECKSDKTKEAWAYAHVEYLLVLKGLEEATFLEEKYRMEIKAAEARVDVWRTEQSNNRVEQKAGGLVT